MTPGDPLVSIVIPVYNGSDYLREAIDSALAQTYSPCEIIVVNDGSNDNGQTEAIAISYGTKIKYFSKPNGGVASALNYGIKMMTGEYFSWLSHDDVYCPRKIEAQIRLFSALPACAIAFSDYQQIDEHSNKLEKVKHGTVSKSRLQELLIADASINGCTLLVPSECFSRVGCFDENLKTTQDYHLWFRFSMVYAFVHLPEVTVLSRMHAKQGSRTMSDIAKKEHNEYRIWAINQYAEDRNAKHIALCLARIAVRLKIVGCNDESRFAASRCGERLNTETLLLRPVVALLLLYRYLWPRKLMVGYVWSYVRHLLFGRI